MSETESQQRGDKASAERTRAGRETETQQSPQQGERAHLALGTGFIVEVHTTV